MITGCFATTGGIPSLAWETQKSTSASMLESHVTLCENAQTFRLKSVIAQLTLWILA